MAGKGTILVATTGSGVLISQDSGESWLEPQMPQGMHVEAIVRSMTQDPQRPEVVYAGSNLGLYRSENGGARWQLLDTPMNEKWVWAIAIDPTDADIIYAGTGTPSIPGIYRSTDGGKTWEHLAMQIADQCQDVGIPRPTQIAIDPTDHRSVWVGIEVDGVRHSTDGGDTWTRVQGVLTNPRPPDTPGVPTPYSHNMGDIHHVLVTSGPPKTVMVQVSDDIWRSSDEGATWTALGFHDMVSMGPAGQGSSTYLHGLATKVDDPQVIFMSIGNLKIGSGAIMRSKDVGSTWERLPLPVEPAAPMWSVSTCQADPNMVFAATRFGSLYRSDDGGDSWSKHPRLFPGINSAAWVP